MIKHEKFETSPYLKNLDKELLLTIIRRTADTIECSNYPVEKILKEMFEVLAQGKFISAKSTTSWTFFDSN